MKHPLVRISAALFVLAILLFIRLELIRINQQKRKLYHNLTKFYHSKYIKKSDFTYLVGKMFKNFELKDLTGKPWDLSDDKSFFKVLIIFDVNDCSSCLLEYTLWKKIHEKFSNKHVLVLGISHTKDIEDLLFFIEQRQINFTVLHDPAESVRKSLGKIPSPLRILLDKNNEILEVHRPDPELALQKKALSTIRQYLKIGIDKNLEKEELKKGGLQ